MLVRGWIGPVRNKGAPAGVDKIAALAYVAARTRHSALLAASFKD